MGISIIMVDIPIKNKSKEHNHMQMIRVFTQDMVELSQMSFRKAIRMEHSGKGKVQNGVFILRKASQEVYANAKR